METKPTYEELEKRVHDLESSIKCHQANKAHFPDGYEELDRVFSMSLDMICIADIHTASFLKVNSAFTRILGYTETELISQSFLDFIHPDDVAPTLAIVNERLQKGIKVFNFTNRYRCKNGAYRFLEWVSHPVPERGITYAVARDITRYRKTEKRLRASEELFRAIFESAPVGMAVIDTQRRFIQVNGQLCRILGYDADELTGRSFNEFTHPDDRGGGRERWRQLLNRELAFNQAEKRYIHKDGRIIWTIANNALITAKNGEPVYVISHLVDISAWKQTEEDRAKLEDQLRQSHKMESVGRLAGGVAHDFNNRLQAILSYTELALLEAGPGNPIERKLLEIQKSALGAADLTRQLLAFARKQTISPRILDMNETVSGMLNMLQRLIGENIDLVWKPGMNIGSVQMDPSQIDQILINLVINARDAIAGVGNLTIETENITFDESYCAQHAGFLAGDYVLLAVSDTGCGISKENLSHIFEPFFTTKALGQGTGLGLAMIYGIVKQNNGFINVYSEPGSGTTFRIYLSRVQPPETVADPPVIQQSSLQGSEVVLLVEDDEIILDISQTILEKYGYTVLLAATPDQAIALVQGHDGPIHLLVTDVIMPGMNGQELMNRIHAIQPTIKTLFMSGYTANVIAHHGVLDKGINFLQKPFSVKTLVEWVRKILDEAEGGRLKTEG